MKTLSLLLTLTLFSAVALAAPGADKDIFSSAFTWRWQLSGLTFVAGRHHLDLGNPNIDTGRIVIEKCAFYNAAFAARPDHPTPGGPDHRL